ncbi:MAG: DUF2795 domain-containing protein [Armatimonadota bacterium]
MVSTATIAQVLDGLDFPASKQDMIRYAQERNAPKDVMETLHQLPDRQYQSMAGVFEAVGEVE